MLKRHFILLAVIAMMFGGSGCMFGFSKPKSKPINEITVAYMEEKYGENFSDAGPNGNSMTGTYSMYVTCDSIPGAKITAKALQFKQEDRIFQDNYLVHKYRADIQDLLYNFVKTEFSDAKVYVSVTNTTLSENVPADADVNQVIQDKNFLLSAVVEVHESEFLEAIQAERVMQKMGQDLCGNELSNYSILFIAVKSENYGKHTETELHQIFADRAYIRAAKLYKSPTSRTTAWKEAEG